MYNIDRLGESLFFSRRIAIVACVLLPSVFSAVVSAAAIRSSCLPLTPSVAAALSDYISKAYDFAPDIRVQDDGILGSTCFRQITFEVASPKQSLSFYLSPDQQYLTTQLVDTRENPRAERERVAAATEKRLLSSESPSKGPTDAPLTIVEFSDFECPFCKRFAGFVDRGKWNARDVRIVFKQTPLPIHPWARKAAVAAACVAAQSDISFWRLHDFLFGHQEEITVATFDDTLRRFLLTETAISSKTLDGCMRQPGTQIEQDEALAEEYQITSTPTIFINGVRQPGFRTEEEFSLAVTKQLDILKAAHRDSAASLIPMKPHQ